MAVASGPAGPVLAGPVLTVAFTSAHAQVINNTSLCLASELQLFLSCARYLRRPNVTGGVA